MKARHRPMVLLAVISLVVACGGDDRSATTSVVSTTTSTATSETTATFVIPGGGAPPERQLAMVAMVEPYIAAWQANDGDGVASFMTPDGYVEYPEMGWTFRAGDGTIQDRVDSISDYATLQTLAPMTVYGDRVALPGRIDSMDLDWVSIIQFTPSVS